MQGHACLVLDIPEGPSDGWFSLRKGQASLDAQSSDGGSQKDGEIVEALTRLVCHGLKCSPTRSTWHNAHNSLEASAIQG